MSKQFTGQVLLIVVAGALAIVLAVVSIVFAANSGEGPKPSPRSQSVSAWVGAGNDIPTGILPEVQLVVVSDLEGYFQDCGCTGEAVGGIARLTSVVECEDTHFVFIGRLLSVRDEQVPAFLNSAYRAQLKRTVQEFSQLASKLTNVTWFADPVELSDLKRWGVDTSEIDPYRESTDFLGAQLTLQDRKLRWLGGELPISGLENRARVVAVFSIWNAQEAMSASEFSLQRGLEVLTRKGWRADDRALLRELNSQVGPIVNARYVALKTEHLEDPALLSIVDRGLQMAAAHNGASQRKESAGKVSNTHAAVKRCSSCHYVQVENWMTTAHSRAYSTLVSVGRQNDYRCLICHVTEKSITYGSAPSVSCSTCHDGSGGGDSSVGTARCRRCHTKLSDPASNYLAHYASIRCPKNLPGAESSKPCNR